MIDKVTNDARIYTDVQGLEQLRYASKNNSPAAKKEVAKQFEAMFMQIVMRSMRDANKAFASDLFGSDQTEYYQEMYDKQLTLLTSDSGLGFAKMIEQNIDEHFPAGKAATNTEQTNLIPSIKQADTQPPPLSLPPMAEKKNTVVTAAAATHASVTPAEPPQPSMFSSPEEFVKGLWASAKNAARTLGTDPRLLIAQAALETNWGKKILPQGNDASSHNLFNIKADASWDKKTTTMDTLEQKNGVLAKEKSTFRSYDSFKDSFADYVSFLKQNGRYNEALDKAAHPEQFIHALQDAGFATDTNYAEKILKIFSSRTFNQLMSKME